jgi:RNA polymerase sigma-70 factor (ECF subfamily)
MNTTPASLLEQLRHPNAQEAWKRFVRLYTPLLYSWARRVGLPDQDAGDLVRDVLTVLVQKLPEFTYDRHKRFRGWLWTVTLNKWRDLRKRRTIPQVDGGQDVLPDLPGPAAGDAFEEAEYRQYLVDRALQLMQAEVQPP